VSSLALEALHLHPRVAQQDIGDEQAKRVLAAALPRVLPFRPQTVHSLVAVLDWDHRLPSKSLTLRLHLAYDASARERFWQAFSRRKKEIAEKNLYPEFDVPDFAGLPADEAYDVELTDTLEIEAMRLTSPWRREIAEEDAHAAVEAVRASSLFADVQRGEASRPDSLGDLEAVSWTPPCESGQPGWTLDVWWLTLFDGRVGQGWSFLVDLEAAARDRVRASRQFTVRAG
jgi:hypothetical protein